MPCYNATLYSYTDYKYHNQTLQIVSQFTHFKITKILESRRHPTVLPNLVNSSEQFARTFESIRE